MINVQGKGITPVKQLLNKNKSKFAMYRSQCRPLYKTQTKCTKNEQVKSSKQKYIVKIGDNYINADKYVEAIYLDIIKMFLKNPSQFKATFNFARWQLDLFDFTVKKDKLFNRLKKAILRDAPQKDIDKIVKSLENFTSKNIKYV